MNSRRRLSTLGYLAAGALLVAGCGRSSGELEDARRTAASLTNQLDRAQTRISELEQTGRTALTNLTLVQNDLTSLSNRLVKVKAELAEARGRSSLAEATANQRAARIHELDEQARETVGLITALREENARGAAKLQQANGRILEAEARRQGVVNERELLKARIVELEQLLNNPEWLRSQYRRVKSARSAPSPLPSGTATPAAPQPPDAPQTED